MKVAKFKSLRVGKAALLVSKLGVIPIKKVSNKDGYNAIDLIDENQALHIGPNALIVC